MNRENQNSGKDKESITTTIRQIIRERFDVGSIEGELADRIREENRVRIIKRQGKKCPHEDNNFCTKIDIRCGERQQYDAPENRTIKGRPHKCNYQPIVSLNEFNVLVVDDDPDLTRLCTDFFVSLDIPKNRIEKAHSVDEAKEILKLGKIENKQYCIVLSDIKMGEQTGFDLVNHLVERNYNSRILLMSGYVEENDCPAHYLGDKEIIPGKKVVSRFFKKPISFSDFSDCIRKIEQEFHLA